MKQNAHPQNEDVGTRTSDIIAKEHGVSHHKVELDAQFARAVDMFPEVKAKIQNGENFRK